VKRPPLAICGFLAIVVVGCFDEPRPAVEEELRMHCDRVDMDQIWIWRCENREAICYAEGNGISCMRKRAPLPPPEET
jgi:hypothetical protein